MFFSPETRQDIRRHLRAACREQLFALRALLDGWIRRVETKIDQLSADEESRVEQPSGDEGSTSPVRRSRRRRAGG